MAEPAADSASKFHQILISSAMPIVASLSRALKTTEEIPTLSKALVVYLEDNQKILPVLRWCIRNDIKGADAWQEVFRGKSLSVQILSDYFIHSGRVYVKNVLLSRLRKQTKNLEIDSRFEKDPQVIAENVEKLTKLARETLDGIIESAGQFPVNLSKALKYMVKQVNKKFPEKGMVVAGMILFSKLYIPPILTPQLLENSKENTADVSRTAILLSKLMQSVAAGTPLDSSNILFKFNDFIVYYSEKLKQFTYGLASIPETPTTAEMLVKIEPDVAKKSFQTIHNFIHQYRHTMLDYRVTKKNASEIKIFQDLVTITEQMLSDLVDGKSLFDELPYTQENGTLSRSRSPTVAERGRKEGSGTPLSPRSPEKKIKQPTSPRYAALEDSSSGNEKEMSQARAIKSKLDDENTRLRKEIKIMQQKIEEKEKLLRQFKLKLAKSLSYRQRKTRHVRQVQKKLVNERFNIRNIEDLDKPMGAPFDPRNRSSTLETPRASSDAGYDASTSPLSSPRNNPSMKDEYSFDASTWSIEEESSRSDSQRSKPSESSESLSSSRKDVSPQPTPDRKGSSGTKMVSPSSKLLDRVRTTPAPVSGGSSPKTPSSERKSTTTVEK